MYLQRFLNLSTKLACVGIAGLCSLAQARLPQASIRAGGIVVLPIENNITQVIANNQSAPLVLEGKQKFAVVGIPLDQPVGDMTITFVEQSGLKLNIAQSIPSYNYPTQYITVKDTSKVNPNTQELERFAKEATEQKAVYKVFTPTVLAAFPKFIAPTQGKQTNTFGSRRFFNGEPRAPHSGMDIPAPEGANAIAPAAGKVALIGDYFFNGKTVIIDHGQGVYSMLCHLSKINVQQGEPLKQGQNIGLVGHTGRATGAHLHWTVSINDARIDPQILLNNQ